MTGQRRLFSVVALVGLACLALATTTAQEKSKKEDDNRDLRAKKTTSAANLKKLARAVVSFATSNDGVLPPAAVLDTDGKPTLSWRVLILAELGEKALYKEFRLNEPWDSPHNKKFLAKMPRVFAAPAGKAKAGETHYQAFTGPSTGFEGKRGLPYPRSFPDGLANTVMLAEAAGAVPWTKPVDLVYHPKKQLPKLGGLFADGFHVVMWDGGTVHFFRDDFDRQQMRNVITRAGGEVMDFAALRR
jgi:hypothetical protein